MDAWELLSELGRVEPADQAVIDSALRRLAKAAGRDSRPVRIGRPAIRRRWLISAAAVAALAAAGTAAVAGGPGLGSVAGDERSRATPRASTVAAILTAFSASSNDILMVTKTMSGDYGTLGPTVIWISPAEPVPGAMVRSRILYSSLTGARQVDQALTYPAPATTPATTPATAGCGAIFLRPRAALLPAAGLPGTLTYVSYLGHFWAKAAVAVRAASAPSAAGLRACLKTGQWHVVGHGVLAGAKAIELATADNSERLWVSSATYLPVRLVSAGPDVDTITFAFRFLPPTAANRAELTPQIPAGFQKRSL